MKQILCFGDSNTYGLIPGTKERYGWGVRWTSILDEKMRGHGYRVIEEGLCGRTTMFEDALRSGRRGTGMLPAILETHSPVELVILMLGTNDCKTIYHASPALIGCGIEQLLDQIRESNPLLPVLLVSPIHLGDSVWKMEYDPEFCRKSVEVSKGLPQVYRQIADARRTGYLAASRYAEPSETDQEHMGKEGHRKLAEALYRAALELIQTCGDPDNIPESFCA